ncbi:tetratricopeptide repeat protein, partial [Acetobacter pomorum]
MVWKPFQKFFGKSGKDAETRLVEAKALLKDKPADAFAQLAVLARENDPEAQFLVGQCYLSAQGAPPDLVEGARWMRRAANNGWTQASFILATLYLYGLPPEVEEQTSLSIFNTSEEQTKREPSFVKAAEWAERAANAGYVDAQALYGYILTAGPEEIRDPEQALIWYQKAADKGCVQGYLGLGLAALAKAKTQEDYSIAADQLKKAAKGGMGTALYLMGVMAERGLGVPQNIQQSTKYFAEAAEKKVR